MCFSAFAQYPGRPAFGTPPYGDNTGGGLSYGYIPLADTAGSTPDTLFIIPGLNGTYKEIYFLTLKDSCVISVSSRNMSFTGSTITIIIQAPSTTNSNVKFLGYSGLATQWVCSSSGTTKFSIAANAVQAITFMCTGAKWIELSRTAL